MTFMSQPRHTGSDTFSTAWPTTCKTKPAYNYTTAKTQVWNASGTLPPGITALSHSEAVWEGGHDQPRAQRGIRVLGLPIGTDEYIQADLTRLHAKQQPLLEAIPTIPDLQTSWLLLLYCASPRAHYALRGLHRLDPRLRHCPWCEMLRDCFTVCTVT